MRSSSATDNRNTMNVGSGTQIDKLYDDGDYVPLSVDPTKRRFCATTYGKEINNRQYINNRFASNNKINPMAREDDALDLGGDLRREQNASGVETAAAPMWVKVLAAVTALLVVLLGVWKRKYVAAALLWPFWLVTGLMSTSVMIQTPVSSLSTFLGFFGYVPEPVVTAMAVKTTGVAVFLGLMAQVLYLGAVAAVGYVVYSYFSK